MNAFTATATGLGIALVLMGQTGGTHAADEASTQVGHETAGPAAVLASPRHDGTSRGSTPEAADRLALGMLHEINGASAAEVSAATLTEVVRQYCQVCHNDVMMTGNLSLTGFDVEAAP